MGIQCSLKRIYIRCPLERAYTCCILAKTNRSSIWLGRENLTLSRQVEKTYKFADWRQVGQSAEIFSLYNRWSKLAVSLSNLGVVHYEKLHVTFLWKSLAWKFYRLQAGKCVLLVSLAILSFGLEFGYAIDLNYINLLTPGLGSTNKVKLKKWSKDRRKKKQTLLLSYRWCTYICTQEFIII